MVNKVVVWMLWFLGCSLAAGRTFTDSQGRTVEADVLGIQGDTVTLSVKGKPVKFPVTQLSVDDQAYLKEWAANPPVAKIHVSLFQREGKRYDGRQGDPIYTTDSGSGGSKTAKEEHQHFQIDLANQSGHPSGSLSVRYKLFVRTDNGGVRELPGKIDTAPIPAGERLTFHTNSMTITDTKTVSRSASTELVYDPRTRDYKTDTKYRKSTSRTNESFGGIWVVAYQNGQKVGEAKSMTDDLKKMDIAQP